MNAEDQEQRRVHLVRVLGSSEGHADGAMEQGKGETTSIVQIAEDLGSMCWVNAERAPAEAHPHACLVMFNQS